MFADTLRQREGVIARSFFSRLARIIREDGLDATLSRLEKATLVHFDEPYRRELRERLRQHYAKRSYPEETYEDWVKRNKRARTSEFEDFDDLIYGDILGEVRAGVEQEQIEMAEIDEMKSARDVIVIKPEIVESQCAESEDKGESDSGKSGESDSGESGESDSGESGEREGDSKTVPATAAPESDSGSAYTASSDSETSDSESSLSVSPSANAPGTPERHPEPDSEEDDARASLKQWSTLDSSRDPTRAIFTVQKKGLDPLYDAEPLSVKAQHYKSLRTFLHLAIMDKKWDISYKIFSLLIKMKRNDPRVIWPLGAEILQGKVEECRKSPRLRFQQKMMQDFQLWLATSFSFDHMLNAKTHHARPFIGHSRTHAPAYVITLVWGLFIEQAFSKVRDVLDELLLKPPFIMHGLFHYMLAVCCVMENVHLDAIAKDFDSIGDIMNQDPVTSKYGDLVQETELLSSIDAIQARIQRNANQAKVLLTQCEELGLEYPKELYGYLSETKTSRTCEKAPKKVYFALRNGVLRLTQNSNFAIPEEEITKKRISEIPKLWIVPFYDGSTCKICGSAVSCEIAALKTHLFGHGITKENFSRHAIFLETQVSEMSESSSDSEVSESDESESEESEIEESETESEVEEPEVDSEVGEPRVALDAESEVEELTDESDAGKSDSEKSDAEKSDAEKSDAEKSDAEKSDAEKSDAEKSDAEKSDAEQEANPPQVSVTAAPSIVPEEHSEVEGHTSPPGPHIDLDTSEEVQSSPSPQSHQTPPFDSTQLEEYHTAPSDSDLDDAQFQDHSTQLDEMVGQSPEHVTSQGQSESYIQPDEVEDKIAQQVAPYGQSVEAPEVFDSPRPPESHSPSQSQSQLDQSHLGKLQMKSFDNEDSRENEADNSGSEYLSAESFVMKVEEDDPVEHNSPELLHNPPEASQSAFDWTQPMNDSSRSRTWLDGTLVLRSLMEENVTESGLQPTQYSPSRSQNDGLEDENESERDNGPQSRFSFSPDSSYNNDYERDMSQTFNQLSNRTRSYFPENNGHDILPLLAGSSVPEVPDVKEEDNLQTLEENTEQVGEKETWSDEFEEKSEEEDNWWDTYGFGEQEDHDSDLEYRESESDSD